MGSKTGKNGISLLEAKFWVINIIAMGIVISYLGVSIWEGLSTLGNFNNGTPFWSASPFQLTFMLSVFYMFQEGTLIQKVMLAKQIKEDDTATELKQMHRISKEQKIELPEFKK